MRKICFLLLTLIIIGGTIFILSRCASTAKSPDIKPEVINVTASQLTIAWLSDTPYKARVFYKPAGTEATPLSAAENIPSDQHEVVVTGLSPSTRYTYWLDDTDARFQFQTQPLPNNPFSFVIVWGNTTGQVLQLMLSEVPEFFVSLNKPGIQKVDYFSDARPFVPIYSIIGIDSPFLTTVGSRRATNRIDPWKLDWGGLRLIFIDKNTNFKQLLRTPTAHTLGIITSSDVIETFDAENISKSKFHSALVAHNQKNPNRPLAFVVVTNQPDQAIEIDNINYLAIPTKSNVGAIRIDVDVESTTAFLLDRQKEIPLRKPPLKQKRTCQQCRRLADRGAYDQSIQAYKDFIENNQGHFQIDDAYYAIAEIFDEKLFKFADALKWYTRLIDEYPDGTLTPLAKQRIKYLSVYSDYSYEPLARFERIRKIEFARKKHRPQERDKLLKETDSIITKYPESKLAPVIQYWLANQYRLIDPSQAVTAYEKLRKNYPNHPHSKEVLMEIGETYYNAAQYKKAMKVYKDALVELPSLTDTINAQIARAERNLRRQKITWVCWSILTLLTIVTVSKKPFGINRTKIIHALIVFILLEIILFFGAWLIHEQFSSSAEMLSLVTCFSLAAAMASLISENITEKLLKQPYILTKGLLAAFAGTVIGIIFFISGIYLTIYYMNVHYLIIVGM